MTEQCEGRFHIDCSDSRPALCGMDSPTAGEAARASFPSLRAVWHNGWKAVSVSPTIAVPGRLEAGGWELYDTGEDPSDAQDLAIECPTKLRELVDLWFLEEDIRDLCPDLEREDTRDGKRRLTGRE